MCSAAHGWVGLGRIVYAVELGPAGRVAVRVGLRRRRRSRRSRSARSCRARSSTVRPRSSRTRSAPSTRRFAHRHPLTQPTRQYAPRTPVISSRSKTPTHARARLARPNWTRPPRQLSPGATPAHSTARPQPANSARAQSRTATGPPIRGPVDERAHALPSMAHARSHAISADRWRQRSTQAGSAPETGPRLIRPGQPFTSAGRGSERADGVPAPSFSPALCSAASTWTRRRRSSPLLRRQGGSAAIGAACCLPFPSLGRGPVGRDRACTIRTSTSPIRACVRRPWASSLTGESGRRRW